MHKKGQFAIELFFAFTFAILLVFWLINYIELFSNTADKVPMQVTQSFIAKDIGKVVDSVCVNGQSTYIGGTTIKLLYETPCLQQKKESWPYNVSLGVDEYTLVVKSDFVNTSAKYRASCPLQIETNLTRCTPAERLCIYKRGINDGMGKAKQVVRITTILGECI